jgi:hypothetical protein
LRPHAAIGHDLLTEGKVQPGTRVPWKYKTTGPAGITHFAGVQHPAAAIYLDLAHLPTITTARQAGISGTALARILDSPVTGDRTVDGMYMPSHIHTLYSQERQRDLLARAHRQRLARELRRPAGARERTGRCWRGRTARPAIKLLRWHRVVR